MVINPYRSLFHPIDNYFLAHSVGCLAFVSQQENEAFYRSWGQDASEAWPFWLNYLESFRKELGALLNASPESFCPQSNVSSALCKVIQSLPETVAAKKIVMTSLDFPSAVFAVSHAHQPTREVAVIQDKNKLITLADWEQALTDEAAVAFITHVTYENNLQQPVQEIIQLCQQRGILTIIDIAQSVGITSIDLDRLQADFVVGTCVKWLCGGPGAGFLYVNPKRVREWSPKDVGWFSHQDPFEFRYDHFEYAHTAQRFFGGTPSILPFVNASASLKLFNNIGIASVISHNRALIDEFIANFYYKEKLFRYTNPACEFGGTIAIELPQAAHVLPTLREKNIAVDARGDFLRLSPHLYTSSYEVMYACEVLNTLITTL